jgi:hypothetical protein
MLAILWPLPRWVSWRKPPQRGEFRLIDAGQKHGSEIRSAALPGGSLILALIDRRLMALADKGASSRLIGHRWAQLCISYLNSLVGSDVQIPGNHERHHIERVLRLDDQPQVTHRASRLALQNPDFLLLGRDGDRRSIQAADAKFSVETARSKQVSPDVVSGLFGIGQTFSKLLGEWREGAVAIPGLFVSPDTALTAYIFAGKKGITRSTVHRDEVVLLDVNSIELVGGLPGEPLILPLANLDRLGSAVDEDTLAALYYFRLARAATACWTDSVRPLLAVSDGFAADDSRIVEEIARRSQADVTAFKLILNWEEETNQIRRLRSMVDRAASLPVPNRELRDWVEIEANELSVPLPSVNQIRKRLGAWYRRQLCERLGPIDPQTPNLYHTLSEIRRYGTLIAPQLRRESARIVAEMARSAEDASTLGC